jgi:hypothetical protein
MTCIETSRVAHFGEMCVVGGLVTKRVEMNTRNGEPAEEIEEVELLSVLRAEAVEDMEEVRAAPRFAPGESGLIETPGGPVGVTPRALTPPSTATRRTAPHDSMHK